MCGSLLSPILCYALINVEFDDVIVYYQCCPHCYSVVIIAILVINVVSKAKKMEQDSLPPKQANRREFQDFSFPSKTRSLIISCKSLFGGPDSTSNDVCTSDTTNTPDEKSLSFAESSLHNNRKMSSSFNNEVDMVISHADESISKCPAASMLESTAIRNRRTIKLNGNKSMFFMSS